MSPPSSKPSPRSTRADPLTQQKRLSEKLYRAASSRNGENVIQLGHEKKTISSRLQTVRDEPGGIDAAEL
jgi:hypothetical protein